MTLQEVNEMVNTIAEEIKCPCAYYSFKRDDSEKPSQKPPYLVFYYPEDDDLYADNTNYCNIKALTIEFYSDFKDFDKEKKIEKMLKDYGITYDAESVYVSGEHLYEQIYTMEVVINE